MIFRKLGFCRQLNINISKSNINLISPRRNLNSKLFAVKDQAKKSKAVRLLSLLKSEKLNITVGTTCLLISSGITMSVPYALGKILDTIFDKSDTAAETKKKLKNICGVLGVIFLFGGAANFCRIYLFNSASLRIVNNLKNKLYNRMLVQEISWFETKGTGELVHRLSNDTHLVGNSLSQNLSDGLRSVIMFGIGSGMMIFTSPTLTLISACVTPILGGLAVINGRYIRSLTKKLMDKNAEISKLAEERFGNIKTVKSFSKEVQEGENFYRVVGEYINLGYKEILAKSAFYGMAGFSGNVIIISVLYFGGNLVVNNTLTIGELTSFILYATYSALSMNGLSNFYTELNKGIGSAERIWEILDRKSSILLNTGVSPTTSPTGHITFENVSFSYPSRPHNVILDNINLQLEHKKSYAIVGKSGSGKTTLANLILRFYDPDQGAIKIDSYDIKSLNVTWLRNQIGAVSQDPILFSGTIKNNILYGLDNSKNTTVSQQLLEDITHQANVDEFLPNLPNGIDTIVGERGVMLSGGQKQRVAIARAIIKNPSILIFDEATSSLDTVTEEFVQNSLEKLKKGRTVITIAHRLSTIRNSDKIIVLDKGFVSEEGTYDELICKPNGLFKELVKSQSFMVDVAG